jgi:hypothetical protein
MEFQICIESDNPDPFYFWLKSRGGMDFVRGFVRPGSERGVRLSMTRIDVNHDQHHTIITDRITPENVPDLLQRIQFFC